MRGFLASRRRTGASTTRPRRQPRSVRLLTRAVSVAILLLAAIAAASLYWSVRDTRRATAEWQRARERQSLAEAALVDLRAERRIASGVAAGVTPELGEGSARLDRTLRQAAATADDRRELTLWALAAREVAEYRAARRRSEVGGAGADWIARDTAPSFTRAIDVLEVVRGTQRQRLDDAFERMHRTAVLSDLVGAGLTGMFLVALLVLVVTIRSSIVAPLLLLHTAIDRFRDGEMGARAPEAGAREARDVARAYNGMADTIVAQRSGQFTYLAGVAHDLRNPLGTMKMGLALIVCPEWSPGSARARELLDHQIDRMSRMVDDLLDATRFEAGSLRMKVEDFDLAERVREAAEVHGAAFTAHRMLIDVPQGPVCVHGDPVRIDQVLNNLLTNAAKFSSPGSRVDVRLSVRGRSAVVEVRDRGIGMTEEELRDVFAPIRRHAPEAAPGAGLGLSIAQRIVRAHGGRIDVESQIGEGSTFRVTLPLAPEDSRPEGAAAAAPA